MELFKIILLNFIVIFIVYNLFKMDIHGDWGLGIGDWGLGIGDWECYFLNNYIYQKYF